MYKRIIFKGKSYITGNMRLLDLAVKRMKFSTFECNFWQCVRRRLRGLKSRATDRKINICGETRSAGGANSTVKIHDQQTPASFARSRITYLLVFSHRLSRKYRRPSPSSPPYGQHQFPSFIIFFVIFIMLLFRPYVSEISIKQKKVLENEGI